MSDLMSHAALLNTVFKTEIFHEAESSEQRVVEI